MERSHRDFLDIDDVRLSTTQIYKYNPNTTNGVAAACMLSRSTFILCNVHRLKSAATQILFSNKRPRAQYKDPCLSPGHAPQGEYIVSSGSEHIPIYCDEKQPREDMERDTAFWNELQSDSPFPKGAAEMILADHHYKRALPGPNYASCTSYFKMKVGYGGRKMKVNRCGEDAISAKYICKDKCRNSDVKERCGLNEDVGTSVEENILRWFGANICDKKSTGVTLKTPM
ncbi:hypothetical protein EVAR_19017_1 [Eumeta japonica]|uniref:Uncharacterized protein n=1 Tax=Eumeta variegata TaxID=151549 RepID=A0A4C1V815_EUMVA|nr:hypothetical protein EVAR_19017_1 [Eumeta japonica]